MKQEKLTIVLLTYNSNKTIEKCLKSLEKQTNKNFEVLIIDDDSTDNTLNIVNSFLPKSKVSFKILRNGHHSIPIGRNIGIKNCKTKYITFLDSDAYANRDWVENILKNFREDNELAIVGGDTLPIYTSNLSYANAIVYETIRNFTRKGIWKIEGGNSAWNLKKLKGKYFDEKFKHCEDIEFFNRIKKDYKIKHNKNIKIKHEHRDSLRGYFNQQYKYSIWETFFSNVKKGGVRLSAKIPSLMIIFSIILAFISPYLLLTIPLFSLMFASFVFAHKRPKLKFLPYLFLSFFIKIVGWGLGTIKGDLEILFRSKRYKKLIINNSEKQRIFFLTDIISPMKVPVYEELSKKYDLTMFFSKEKTKDRLWDTNLEKYKFKRKILPFIDIGPFTLNYTILKELIMNPSEIYIIGEIPENILTNFLIVGYTKLLRKKLVVFSGAISNEVTKEGKFKEGKLAETIIRIYRGILFKSANALLTYGSFGKNFMTSYRINKTKIFSGTQILPEECLSSVKISKKISKKIIFLYLGYLNKRKGVKYLIKAFNKLHNDNCYLHVIGDGNEKNNLLKKARKNNSIKFFNYTEGERKAKHYINSDVFILPTNFDCWGLTINESLYYGLPVISTNKAGATELIEDGKTGLIIPSKNVDALTNAMKKLLDNSNLLNQMKKNVKKIPKSKIVDINTSVKTFEKAINYALNSQNETKH